MNPAVLLALGAVAVLALSGKKGGAKNGKDPTGTMPKPGPGPTPPAATEEQAQNELAYVEVAVEASQQPDWGPIYFLGQDGIDQAVMGVDAEGFVHAVPGEHLSGWLTRVAYWGAYQMQGWPMELPIQCILPETCPEDMLPVRDAVLRINEMVKALMEVKGIMETSL
jgi:hypothetical protein